MEPGVSGALCDGMPPGKENCLNSRPIPAPSALLRGYCSAMRTTPFTERTRHLPGSQAIGLHPATADPGGALISATPRRYLVRRSLISAQLAQEGVLGLVRAHLDPRVDHGRP